MALSQYILGIKPTLAGMSIEPCVPVWLKGYTVRRVYRGAVYSIRVENPSGVQSGVVGITVDGAPQSGGVITPIPGKEKYDIVVRMG